MNQKQQPNVETLDTPAPRDYRAEFDAQPSLTKKEAMKLVPGTWVEVKWFDGPNNMWLLLTKPDLRSAGSSSVYVWRPDARRYWTSTSIEYDQIVRTHGMIEVPALVIGSK